MKYDALIVIDMQTALINAHPYNEAAVIENIVKLLHLSRERQIPIIYVRHDGGSGDELESGSDGWQILKEIAPEPGDKIIDKKYNSIFRKTELREYLEKSGKKNLILCGMQTEYCFDVSCKVAYEYEFNVTVPEGTTTTFDNALCSGKDLTEYYESRIWNHRYARVLPLEQILEEIKWE